MFLRHLVKFIVGGTIRHLLSSKKKSNKGRKYTSPVPADRPRSFVQKLNAAELRAIEQKYAPPRANSAEGRRPSTGPKKRRSAAGVRKRGV